MFIISAKTYAENCIYNAVDKKDVVDKMLKKSMI